MRPPRTSRAAIEVIGAVLEVVGAAIEVVGAATKVFCVTAKFIPFYMPSFIGKNIFIYILKSYVFIFLGINSEELNT